jgi:hypothetical protein
MKKSIFAVAAVIALGFSGPISADQTAAEQTSPEQVQICETGLQGCQGGDVNACHAALKTCVGEQRLQAMKAMEES